MDLKEMNKQKEVFTLREPIELDALFTLMQQSGLPWPSNYQLKKGLLGKNIAFEVYMSIAVKISVKNNTVTVAKFTDSTKVSVGGGPGVDYKHQKQMKDAKAEGAGFMEAAMAGVNRFHEIIGLVGQLLQDRM